MTRSMGDATSANLTALIAAGPWQLVAGYVTGTPDVQWTASDWAMFPESVLVTIDQGYQSPAVTTATVRDYEPGAWYDASVADTSNWDAERPTIYCDQDDLATVLSDGWQGCLWLAIIGWQVGDALPSAPGCQIVAVQNAQNVSAAYDTSIVLDPTWPSEGSSNMLIIGVEGAAPVYLLSGGRIHQITDTTSLNAYLGAGIPSVTVTQTEASALLTDFVPGNPSVTVGDITFPTYTSTPS